MPRVLVVSNRLPVTIHPDRPAPHDIEQSSGGLVSALRSVVDDYEEVVWIGWPGSFVPSRADERRFTARLQEESTSILLRPVWLEQSDVEDFYNGFSNSSLWPLLHWMSPYARFKKAWAESYRRVNQRFAEAVLEEHRPGDLIWVHDYHLFSLPLMLRRVRDTGRGRSSSASSAQEEHGRPRRPSYLPPPIEDEERAFPEDAPPSCGGQPALRPGPSGNQGDPMERFLSVEPDEVSSLNDHAGNLEASKKKVRIHQAPSEVTEGNPDVDVSVTKLKVAFFLHTPFPPFEIMSSLPNCVEIVEGMLGADLVGFHTYSYLRHFRSCVIRLCGVTPEMDHVQYNGQCTKLGVFPIGANWQGISEAMKTERFTEHLRTYTKQYEGKSLVLSVERLDYSKGMPQKLAAIERYLELARQAQKEKKEQALAQAQAQAAAREEDPNADREERRKVLNRGRSDRLLGLTRRFEERKAANRSRTFFRAASASIEKLCSRTFSGADSESLDHARTVFLFIAVPSRQEVQEYKTIEEEVHRTISAINGRFSTLTHQPIVYIHRSVSIDELAALYARADLCLVTPLIDGMNLVAKEYIAAKDRAVDKVVPGSIVLSEGAGAAQELFDALVVNPYDVDAVADAIYLGLELTKGDHLTQDHRWEVTARMRAAVLQNDAVAWARNVLSELQVPNRSASVRSESSAVQLLPDSAAARFSANFPGTKAIFLDFDGTFDEGGAKVESELKSEAAQALFHGLAARGDLKVFILSRQTKEALEEAFGDHESFTLIAESGFLARSPGKDWCPFTPYTSTEWMHKVKSVMDLFTRCTPGAKMVMRAYSIVWHYGEDEYSRFKAKELVHQLALSLGNLPCQVSQGDKLVRVESLQLNKGLALRTVCLVQDKVHEPFREVLCIGDDHTDESMFSDAPPSAWTVTVGFSDTHARHCLRDSAEVRRFLQMVAGHKPREPHMPECFSESTLQFKSIDVDERTTQNGEGEEEDPLAGLAEEEFQDAPHEDSPKRGEGGARA